MRLSKIILACVVIAAAAPALLAVDPEGVEVTRYLPEFQTQQTVEELKEGLAPARELDSKLGKRTDEIWKLVEQYRKSPSTELENRIYNKVAEAGELMVESISSIQSQRDRLRDELRKLNYNVGGILRNLENYTTSLDGRIGDVLEEAKPLKDELKALAQELRQDRENEELREQFRRKLLDFQRLRVKLKILRRNRDMYSSLADQIGSVSSFFENFDQRLDTVLQSLATHKKLIEMNLTVLRDKARVVAWLRGESAGGRGAGELVKQLRDLSGTIGDFQKITDVMMNLGTDFDSFTGLVPEIEGEGLVPAGELTDEKLDELIDAFAKE